MFVVEFVKGVREKDHGICGPALWEMYKRQFSGTECMVGRDKLYEIMDKYDLKVRQKRRKPQTTDSRHSLPVYHNLIKNLIPTHVNQIWASDITYLPLWIDEEHTEYIFCYLSLILDLYSKEIVGYSVGDSLATKYPIEALKMALTRIEEQDADLIHHSDRGIQYASYAYTDLLKSHNVNISMTESGNPKDNAQAERINNTMKNELLYGMEFENIEQVKEAVKCAVDFYNNERPHMSIDYMTPAEAAKCSGEIMKKWKSYREMHIKENEIA